MVSAKIRAMLKKHMDDKDDKTPSHDVNEKKKARRK